MLAEARNSDPEALIAATSMCVPASLSSRYMATCEQGRVLASGPQQSTPAESTTTTLPCKHAQGKGDRTNLFWRASVLELGVEDGLGLRIQNHSRHRDQPDSAGGRAGKTGEVGLPKRAHGRVKSKQLVQP